MSDTHSQSRTGRSPPARVPVALAVLALPPLAQAEKVCSLRDYVCLRSALQGAFSALRYLIRRLTCIVQGSEGFASCGGAEVLPGGERVSSFAVLASVSNLALHLHKLTSRPLRLSPSAAHAAVSGPLKWRSEILYEQQWQALQPYNAQVVRSSGGPLRNVQPVWLRCWPKGRVGGRSSILLDKRAAAEAISTCATCVRQAQAGLSAAAFLTRAAQPACKLDAPCEVVHALLR